MRCHIKFLLLPLMFFIYAGLLAQSTYGRVEGKIVDSFGDPVPDVSVSYEDKGTVSDKQGQYRLNIPAGKKVELLFSHVSFEDVRIPVLLKAGELKVINVEIPENVENMKDIVIRAHKDNVEGITNVQVETIQVIPSSSNSMKEVITGMGLGASSDNELSSQYKVRGGNYDENLVYVNGIEVYRPFLIRSGRQEGLPFVNTDMADHVRFSSGGFQAAYGDKLSSVLDITYRRPESFASRGDVSLTGASLTTDWASQNKKNTAILGLRYKNNSLIVQNKNSDADYYPEFADMQIFTTHRLSKKFELRLLGNLALNNYLYRPKYKHTKFGSLLNPLELTVRYDGSEKDRYYTGFGAVQSVYAFNKDMELGVTASLFHTQEEEYFDIQAGYYIGVPNADAGSDDYGESVIQHQIGAQIDHARNALDALIGDLNVKWKYLSGENEFLAGIGYRRENIRDRLREWQVIDSAGFSVRPPGELSNDQPYEPYEGPIVPYQYIEGEHQTDIERYMGFVQWSRKYKTEDYEMHTNIGIRGHAWTPESGTQYVVSPRVKWSYKPYWEKDLLFRVSGGLYAQPPVYRELRDFDGQLHPEVKAQKSWQVVLGSDYGFRMWDRDFLLTAESYYKYLTDVNPYNVDNVRIRYQAANNAVAYAYGLDFRLNGEFVSGAESWLNFGFLKTEENIDGRGYIARPTDQRIKFALLFQDYVPSIPNLKMYMNLIYNTGVPGGAPAYSDPYDYQSLLGDYRRVDLGIFYVFKDASNPGKHSWTKRFKELSVGGEIFNMFDIQNSITNTWVRDTYSKQMYAVHNYMTGRFFNLRIKWKI